MMHLVHMLPPAHKRKKEKNERKRWGAELNQFPLLTSQLLLKVAYLHAAQITSWQRKWGGKRRRKNPKLYFEEILWFVKKRKKSEEPMEPIGSALISIVATWLTHWICHRWTSSIWRKIQIRQLIWREIRNQENLAITPNFPLNNLCLAPPTEAKKRKSCQRRRITLGLMELILLKKFLNGGQEQTFWKVTVFVLKHFINTAFVIYLYPFEDIYELDKKLEKLRVRKTGWHRNIKFVFNLLQTWSLILDSFL